MTESNTISSHASRPHETFHKKEINVTFTVASGALGQSPTDDTVTLKGMRCRATIINGGQNYGNQLSLRIDGMSLSLMNRLSVVIGMGDSSNIINANYTASTVRVDAGDDRYGLSTIFIGQIAEAFADFTGSPDVSFNVIAYATLAYQVDKPQPTTSNGDRAAIEIIQEIAGRAGLTVVNHGVNIILTNDYRSGDTITQISGIVQSFGGVFNIDTVTKTLHVYPNNSSVNSDGVMVLITPQTGLIGYPTYNQNGIGITSFFNPLIQYFSPFKLKTDYAPGGWVDNQMGQDIGPKMPVNGEWLPYLITHDISSETPNGPWFTYINAIRSDWADRTAAK